MAKKILIAEDETSLLEILKNRVEQLGFKVVTARDGEETLQKFAEEKPDLILLDILMPKVNGFEVLEELKVKQKSPVPIIILTNLDQAEEVERGKSLGAVDYIVKTNISLKDLMTMVNNYIESMD
ncbi:MAG TPA: response regulator [Candidatus Dojkabacteria bacterium]|nr:response regulator [Candidatus Dojkabacteria bacterium]